MMINNIPTIIVTCGDINGIGPEIFLKAVPQFSSKVRFIVTVPTLISRYFDFPIDGTLLKPESEPLSPGIFLYPIETETEYIPSPGVLSDISGRIALDSFKQAISLVKTSPSFGLLTLPIHKKSFSMAGSIYKGHTDFLESVFKNSEPLMILSNSKMKVGLLTVHVPIQRVSENINAFKIEKKAVHFYNSLQKDFNISSPKIALLGLNPHAGDEGVIGNEEIELYAPAIHNLQAQNINITGPYSADGFFGSGHFSEFDGILASYHDQGLIPFKLSDMAHGVNFSANLPIVRTSPDHGVAFDIAGKNIADPSSLIAAIQLNLSILNHRLKSFEISGSI